MNLIFMALMVMIMLIMIMSIMIMMISKKTMIELQKSSPFECGFNPMSNKRMPFSIHFFLIAVLFLIFDIEIIIIFPMIMTMKMSIIKYWLIFSVMFMVILILGIMHEWNNGMLSWSK